MKKRLKSTVEGKGKRGRKRKRVKSPKEEEEDDDGVGTNSVNDHNVLALISDNGSKQLQNYVISLPEVRDKEEITGFEASGFPDNGTNIDAAVNADIDARQTNGVLSKGRRGRKRKNVEALVCDGKRVEKVVSDQANGWILRSRNAVFAENIGVERQREVDKKRIKVEMVEDERLERSKRGRKKKKGRRGRPPKINPGIGASTLVVGKKGKVVESKNIKKLRPKLEKRIGWSKTVNCTREEVSKLRGNINKVTVKESNSSEKKQTGSREEKQLVRERILAMLKKAGWTTEYRPRNGTESSDTVYVEANGRTHWSVTKAYRILEEKVHSGNADDQEVAAFTVIPEEVLSILFKVMEKKRKDFGTRRSKGFTERELPGGTSSSKTLADSKRKEKLNSSKSCVRKPKSKPEEGRDKKRYALLARSSEMGSDSNGDGFVLYDGKRSLLSWMIDLETVPKSGKVQYMNSRGTTVLCEGKITGDGIRCDCCNDIHTVLDFESHAGGKSGEPFKNIYLASGPSLLQCLVDSWNKIETSHDLGFLFVDVAGDDPNDDTCNICGDGGDLICCDSCPSTFHQSCLDIQNFPAGDWHCVYCSCKFCGSLDGHTSQGVDIHETVSKLFTCQLCEEKFHIRCIEGNYAMRIDLTSPFCGEGCQKLFKHLHELLGVRHELEEGFSWTVLRRHDIGRDVLCSDDLLKLECNSKLAVAFSIMDEGFLPIVDHRSKTNLIHNVVYNCGSNFRRLNYSGFYTFILERGDEVISAASIRVHGNQLAEMPFIATRYMYRHQGMCRRLLTAIEMALCCLDVEKLVIPAITDLMETWRKVFGFMPIAESKRPEMRYMSMIVFPHTDMLQKPLGKHQLTSGQMTSGAGYKLLSESKSKLEDQTMDEVRSKYLMNCSPGAECGALSDVELGKDDEADAVARSGDSLADGLLNDGSDIINGANNSKELFNDEECLNLNASIGSKRVSAPENSAVDGPSVDVQHTAEEIKICQSAEYNSAAIRFHEKAVKCLPKLNQQDGCLDESESTVTQVKPNTLDHEEDIVRLSEDGEGTVDYQHNSDSEYLKLERTTVVCYRRRKRIEGF